MKMLQRIVSAFAGRNTSAGDARAEVPVDAEFHRIVPGAPRAEPALDEDEICLRTAVNDPSVAAKRLWCSAGHF